MQIPLVRTNIPPSHVLIPALERVLYSGYVAQGPVVEQFERAFAAQIGAGYSLSVNSGTAALHIALILAGVGPGDEVVSTPLTAEPTNVAIKMSGASIRYADIDYNTGNIDAASVRTRINHRTRAIVAVDYAGVPVNVEHLQELSLETGIPVIEDAAHALGATWNGVQSGGHFPFTAFSFQAIKHLTTIDGGVLQVTREAHYNDGKLVRWFGLDKTVSRQENRIRRQGFKYHMNDVTATIGLLQLRTIEQTLKAHIANGEYFDRELRDVAGVELLRYYPGSRPSYWLYTLKVRDREGFIRRLGEHGIAASPLHVRNDVHPFLHDFDDTLPQMDRFYKHFVHIPCGWWLTKEEREKVALVIRQGW